MANPQDLPEVVVCAGPPLCLFSDNEAIASAKAGCPLCRRIICLPNGKEVEYQARVN